MIQLVVPVLLIGFNRPDVIIQTFERIRMAKPKKLYVAIDGPRSGKVGESALVGKVKEIVKQVDWECEPHYRLSETNVGCEVNVSSAVTWALENEEYVIVLEDDIIAPLSFFYFAQEMLVKYKDYPQIAMVTSNNFTPISTPNEIDYFFCHNGHTWGWATWKRVWADFKLNMEIEDHFLTKNKLQLFFPNRRSVNFYRRLYKRFQKEGRGNVTWDWMFDYFRYKNNLFSIVPRVNLSSNIGEYGYHAKGETNVHYLKYDDAFAANKHPEMVFWNKDYDIYHYDKYIMGSLKTRIRSRLVELCPPKLRQRISKLIHKN